jgi:hypothetical protein
VLWHFSFLSGMPGWAVESTKPCFILPGDCEGESSPCFDCFGSTGPVLV